MRGCCGGCWGSTRIIEWKGGGLFGVRDSGSVLGENSSPRAEPGPRIPDPEPFAAACGIHTSFPCEFFSVRSRWRRGGGGREGEECQDGGGGGYGLGGGKRVEERRRWG